MKLDRLFLTSFMVVGAGAQASFADVSADDVWANLMAPSTAFGFTVEAETVRDGNRLVADTVILSYELPLDLGTLRLESNGMTLEEQGDGTVALIYPDAMRYQIAGDFAEGNTFSLGFEISGDGYQTRASGQPGMVTYDASYQNVTFRLTDFEATGEADMEIELEGTISGAGVYTITEGDVVTMSIVGENEKMTFESVTTDQLGITSTARQTFTGGASELGLAIPAGQVDPMNLANALRAGLAMTGKNTGGTIATENETVAEGLRVVQNAGYTMTDMDFVLNAEGLETGGRYDDLDFEVRFEPDLPFPIIGQIASTEGRFALPVVQSDEVEEMAMSMVLNDLTLNEEIWALIDAAGVLPRDPMTVVLDLSGEATLERDVLDIAQMMAVDVSEEPLGELRGLTLNRLQLSAAGAEMTGEGSFAFDNADFETFPGFPAPSGALDLAVSGANGLLDKLVEIGLLPEDQAMGTRMMMGLFGTPGEGEDEITSTIEVTEDGQVLANGQRLR